MRVLIVILNYRTPQLTIDCLRSLMPQVEGRDDHVVVVDSASGDDSIARISAELECPTWSSRASLLSLAENRGYAAGNNAAIRVALSRPDRPSYVLLLNSDTIVLPGAIDDLVAFMEASPPAGIAGSRLQALDGTPQTSAFRFPSALSEFEEGIRLGVMSRLLSRWRVAVPVSDQPHTADWVAGASFLVRTEIFDDVGLMDEGFFLYYEEVDFCWRVQQAGWECWYVPSSKVVHLVGQSTGVSRLDHLRVKRRPTYWFESRRRYFVKRYGTAGLLLLDLLWATGRLGLMLRRALSWKPRHINTPDRFGVDLLMGDLKAVLAGRTLGLRVE